MRLRVLLALMALASLPFLPLASRSRPQSTEAVGERRLSQLQQSQISAVYTLPESDWLLFELPRVPEPIRVLTSGSLAVRPAAAEETDLEWRYALEYRLLDASGGVLVGRRYHHATRLTEYREARGERVTGSFYFAGGLVPTDTRVMLLHPLDLPPRAARLALRLAEKDPELVDVTARVYHNETVAPRNLRHQWQRLPEERRQLLARANVYPAALLTESEKRNLLGRRWAAIAPEGVEGRDYKRRELYTPRELPGEEIRDEPLPGGFLAGPELHGVVPLPESGGRVRLLLEPVGSEPPPPPGTILIRWFGRSLLERSERRLVWNGGSVEFEAPFAGGLLEVTSSLNMTLRAWLRRAGSETREEEITPEPAYVWAYLIEGEVAVEFQLRSASQALPFRLDLRRPAASFASGSSQASGPEARYELLSEDGRTLEAGTLAVAAPVSRHDAWPVRGRLTRISEAAIYYFALPPATARLRVVSPQAPLLVTAYDRPAALPRRIAIPEDAYDFNRDDVLQRPWFLLKAANAVKLARLGRAPSLRVQPRPPADVPEVRIGQYLREEFQPEGARGARPLLTPWEWAETPGGKALSSAFCELPAGEDVPLRIESEDGRREASPALLYLSPSAGALTLRSFLDGSLRHEVTVHAGRGLVALPRVALGPHRFRATASRAARLWLSHVEPCSGRRLLKRLAYPIPAAGLSFSVEKRTAGDETLAARFYAARGAASRIPVRVALTPDRGRRVGPQRSWTFVDREYSIRALGGEPVPLLEAGLEDVDGGQLFAIPLGSDLLPGRYQVRVVPEGGARVWLSLSRTSGLAEERELYLERAAGM